MKKKGFTLIELLAVIVILAIISLIAVPVILNIIRDAKKSSAKDSAYGYIKAVENYQALEMLKGNKGLKEGKYNTVSETTIGETKYKKLNDIVSLKGDKPTGGTVTILKNQTVGSAYLCINNYVVEYLNNEANIVSDDCGEMGSIIEFVVDSEDYQINRTLTINYPKGKYEYYYKVSGKAKLNDTYIEKDKEIKTENNVSILLEENQTVEVWMIKNGKKISLRNYVEEKIDNVEIGKIAIKDNTSIYPTLTKDGVKYAVNIELDYEEQEGTSAYYSVDDGITWEKYTKSVTKNVSPNKIKAKMVRDKSKREGEIVSLDLTNSTVSSDIEEYKKMFDGDDNTYLTGSNLKDYNIYIRISDEMQNNKIRIKWRDNNSYGTISHVFLDEDKKEISNTQVTLPNLATVDKGYYIPANARYLKLYVSYSCYVYEISKTDFYNDVINEKYEYPKITSSGIKKGGEYVKIVSASNAAKYKIENGNYKDYNNELIFLEENEKITVKSTNPDTKEENILEYNGKILNDSIGYLAFDNDKKSFFGPFDTKNIYINIDESAWGKKINISSKGYQVLKFYESKGGKVVKSMGDFRSTSNTFEIPTGAYVMEYYFNESGGIYNMSISD